MRYIDVELDKPRTLRFDINGLDALERHLGGKPLVEILDLFQRASVTALKIALWQALRHEDKNLTLDKVGVLMQDFLDSGHELHELRDLLMDALYASGIAKRDEEAAPPDPPTT